MQSFTCYACGLHVEYVGMFPGVYIEMPKINMMEGYFCTPECAIPELQAVIDDRVAKLLKDLEAT